MKTQYQDLTGSQQAIANAIERIFLNNARVKQGDFVRALGYVIGKYRPSKSSIAPSVDDAIKGDAPTSKVVGDFSGKKEWVVSWVEEHSCVVKAETKEEAKDKAMSRSPENTIDDMKVSVEEME